MPRYTVNIPVTADTPGDAARILIDALGADENSINDIGGVEVSPVVTSRSHPESLFLVCESCGEAFESIAAAHEHGVFIPGPDPSWCGENGFLILPESEAL